MSERLRRALVPAVPLCFSLVLSGCTVGTTVYWQDSGFYLTAVHELSVLYPHGFVLYELLCKGWTLAAAPIFGFTLSVHLFSSLAAAAGAAFTALAARAFLRRVEPGRPAELPSIAAGMLLAAGYCYGAAAILAKVYALYGALLALLLWLLVRAETRGDFLAAGAVLGLAWAAHPSAALLAPGMGAYAFVRRDRIRVWGWRFFAAVVAVAAAAAFLPSLFLPVLASRESLADFGCPRTLGEIARYASGQRFTSQATAFGFEGWRWAEGARFTWEEYLGGGWALIILGAARLARLRPAFLALIGAWWAPVAVVTLLFTGEGQFDHWLAEALVPFSLLAALGMSRISSWNRPAAFGVLGAALAWLVAVNLPLLNQRGYRWAESYGRLLLDPLDPNSVVLFSRDDAIAIARYLQVVKGYRRDLLPISNSMLGEDWYDQRLHERCGLRIAPYGVYRGRMPNDPWELAATTAFLNENVGLGRPVFTDLRPSPDWLRRDLAVVPAGMLWKVVPAAQAGLDLKYWNYPLRPEEIPRRSRRARCHWDYETEEGMEFRPEYYEDRLFLPLLWSRARLADALLPKDPRGALGLYEEVVRINPEAADLPRLLYHRAVALYSLNRPGEALGFLEALLRGRPPRELRAFALFYLGEVHAELGRPQEAARRHRETLQEDPPAALRQAIEGRLK